MSDQQTTMRSFHWPIWAAVAGTGNPTRDGMPQLYRDARRSLRESARCKNWLLSQIAVQDSASVGGSQKLPPLKVDTKPIYSRARELFPHLDSQCLSSLLELVKGHYARVRRSVWSFGSQVLPTYRDPQPVIIPNKDYTLQDLGDGRIGLDINLAVSEGEYEERTGKAIKTHKGKGVRWKYTVELAHGKDYKRHTELFHLSREGNCRRGAAVLRIGGRGDLMISIPLEVPVIPSEQKKDRALLLRTDPASLLVVTCQGFHGRMVPVFNEDWIRDKIRLHARWRQRMSEDMRANRADAQTRRGMRRCLAKRCDAQHRRIMDRLHKVARVVADYAAKQHCGLVISDWTCQEWVSPFPWHALRTLLADKLDLYGIEHVGLRVSKGEEASPSEQTQGSIEEKDEWQGTPIRLLENVARLASATGKRDRPASPKRLATESARLGS